MWTHLLCSWSQFHPFLLISIPISLLSVPFYPPFFTMPSLPPSPCHPSLFHHSTLPSILSFSPSSLHSHLLLHSPFYPSLNFSISLSTSPFHLSLFHSTCFHFCLHTHIPPPIFSHPTPSPFSLYRSVSSVTPIPPLPYSTPTSPLAPPHPTQGFGECVSLQVAECSRLF